jgi:hypothetical protein
LKNHRRALVSGVLGLVLVLIVLAWPRRQEPEATLPAPPTERPAARPTAATVANPRPGGVVSEKALAETHQLSQDPAVVALYLEQFKAANRYAPTTVPLMPGMTDVLEPDRVPVSDKPVMSVRNLYTKPEYRLFYRFETNKGRYVAPEPVQLRLTVFRGEHKREPVAVKVAPVSVRRLDASGQPTGLGTVELKESSPGEYTATYLPGTRHGSQEDELLQFEVGWTFDDAKLKPAQERALVQYTSAPPASFTGRFLERLENGSLLVDVEVDSQREGKVQVAGNLFAADGTTPVAVSQVATTLRRGRSWVTLEFYGLVFHDRGLAGPYVLKTLRGHFPSDTSAGRGPELARFEGSHRTRSYPLSDFTTQEWDSPRKRAGIEAYEAELAALRARPRSP